MTLAFSHSSLSDLNAALASVDVSWSWLQRVSSEIVLFGSRAIDQGDARSDWDLLCVGQGRTRRTRCIDLIWISPDELEGAEWLTSELAGHVAAYGRWLAGESTWPARVAPGVEAMEQKRRWLLIRMQAWERHWTHCSRRLRSRYIQAFRRNLQRYALLSDGRPVPPRPVLDRAWALETEPDKRLHALAELAAVNTDFFSRFLLPTLA